MYPQTIESLCLCQHPHNLTLSPVNVTQGSIDSNKIANLIGKLNFYKLIPYPMDNSLSGRRGPARQTSEKDALCLHRLGRPSAVHSPDGV